MPEKLLICTSIALAMKPRGREAPRRSINVQGEGPNWILIAGSALLSTLSIRLGYKLKQVLDAKQLDNSSPSLKGSRNVGDRKQHVNGQMMSEPEMALPLVTVPSSEFNKENGVMWSSSPDRLEIPPQKPFHQSNSSDSPCVSESGSDIFTKREVIQKLRQQLKRRDDMIIEMQDQIADMQNSLAAQVSHSSHLQSLLDSANRDLFDSEREVQRLRKAMADHCVERANSGEKLPSVPLWPAEGTNGHTNGYPEAESSVESSEKGRDESKIDMLKMEVSELKEVIEGKDYLLQNYKEQKSELSVKIKELQQRLDSQLPNIL